MIVIDHNILSKIDDNDYDAYIIKICYHYNE